MGAGMIRVPECEIVRHLKLKPSHFLYPAEHAFAS